MLAAFRYFTKRPIYSIITFIGFSLSICGGLLIYLWVFNELNWDKFHWDYNRVYRVLTLSKQGDDVVKLPGNYRPVPATLKKDYPQIEYATFLSYSSQDSPLQREEGGEKIEARSLWVNNDFFSIFNGFVFIEGDAFTAMENPNGIILSENVAKKLFGNEPALGQTLISDMYSKIIYKVEGVIRVPKNSHIDFGYILTEKNPTVAGYSTHWGDRYFNRVYIKLHKDAEIDDAFLSQITGHISKYSSRITDKLLFQPLADIHLHSDYEAGEFDKGKSSYKYLLIFSFFAIAIILMAVFNFSVLTIARASERSIEIGIKKVNGASRFNIITQFMGEALFQTFLASAFALVLIAIFLPWFNNAMGREIEFVLSFKLLFSLLLITTLTGLLAGAYPSFYLSSLSPFAILKGVTKTGSKNNFISLLVTVQFGIAIFFILGTLFFVKQLNYIHSKDLGIAHDNIVIVDTGLWYDIGNFKQELQRNPSIESVTASTVPVNVGWKMPLALNRQGTIDSLMIGSIWGDEDFAKTYQLEVVKGNFLQMDYSAYWERWKNEGKSNTVTLPVVINETAEKLMEYEDPIGQRIGNYFIVGVVKDFHFRPLHHQIGPIMITNNPESIGHVSIRISPKNRAETVKYINEVYKKHRNDREFQYSFFDDLLQDEYKEDARMRFMIIASAILAIIISVLGMLGMANFSIDRRTKEIGIRKINGASIVELLVYLNGNFVKWVLVAFVIVSPAAWFVIDRWLSNFAYRINLSWWIFAFAGVSVIILALIAVSWHSWKAAVRNPIEALKFE